MAMVQHQYWRELYQLKTHINYIELLLEQSEAADRRLKIVLAVASSSSIGSWVIWSHLAWVWAAIIAASHVVGAINQYLPYQQRIKAYPALIGDLEELSLGAERDWHSVAEGKLTAEQINEARFKIRSQKQKALRKHIATTIPTDERLHLVAEELAKSFLEVFYLGEETA